MERTFVMVKPDGVQRGLVGEIIARFERKGLRLVALKMTQLSRETAEKHYEVHKERQFFPSLIRFITSSPIVAMVWEGRDAVNVVRGLMGSTDAAKAEPGTIRGDYGLDVGNNLVHGSDSLENAEREIAVFFTPDELNEYNRTIEGWIYGE